MAYFSNGCEGEVLDMQCAECALADDAPCPILLVQMNYNYDELMLFREFDHSNIAGVKFQQAYELLRWINEVERLIGRGE